MSSLRGAGGATTSTGPCGLHRAYQRILEVPRPQVYETIRRKVFNRGSGGGYPEMLAPVPTGSDSLSQLDVRLFNASPGVIALVNPDPQAWVERGNLPDLPDAL